jgi:fermentation-respiration switch protein FrsA (DUF1100 family)
VSGSNTEGHLARRKEQLARRQDRPRVAQVDVRPARRVLEGVTLAAPDGGVELAEGRQHADEEVEVGLRDLEDLHDAAAPLGPSLGGEPAAAEAAADQAGRLPRSGAPGSTGFGRNSDGRQPARLGVSR